jgi:hypothetical protein
MAATDAQSDDAVEALVARTSGRVLRDDVIAVELTEHQLDQVVTIESRSGPTPFRYRYTLEPKGSATRLTLDGRISTAGHSGPMARLDGIATRLFERGMQQNLHQLKRNLEAPSNTAYPHRGRRP